MLRNNIEEIIRLRKFGKTLQEIANKFKCTRERIRQLLKKPIKIKPNIYKCQSCNKKIISFHYRRFCEKHKIKLEGKDRLRELVRMRDNYTCQKCGKKWVEGNRRFDVHHLDEECEGWDNKNKKGIYQNDKKNFNKMITLCHKCHLNLPHIRKKMQINPPIVRKCLFCKNKFKKYLSLIRDTKNSGKFCSFICSCKYINKFKKISKI